MVVQLVKNPPAMQDTWAWTLGWDYPWRREHLPSWVFWPGEFHGLYGPWGCKELDMTQRLSHAIIYIYMCVCHKILFKGKNHTHTYTHTSYMYIYIHITKFFFNIWDIWVMDMGGLPSFRHKYLLLMQFLIPEPSVSPWNWWQWLQRWPTR